MWQIVYPQAPLENKKVWLKSWKSYAPKNQNVEISY